MNNIKRNIQKGFTLIELMIVIAIIGILLAIAIPAYSDYTVRARTVECVNNLAPLKTGTSEYYLSHSPNVFPTTLASVGSAQATTMCAAATIPAAGQLSSVSLQAATGGSGPTTIIMSASPGVSNASVIWKCKSSGVIKYAPASCR